MFMILYVLHDETRLDEILSAWDEAGVSGVTILPSTGMGRLRKYSALREDIPLIPSLSDLIENHEEVLNRTLITLVDSQDLIDRVVKATEDTVGPLANHNNGILAVLPVLQIYGRRPTTK
ncbi:MAG: hypothetical protein JW987_12385 [Anaerolineaceae bacterium]|nr:hypothetical protein [Anaerolineaceae bacterium]